jgi:hypothetical protein
MWSLKAAYREAWPQFLTWSQDEIITLLSLRGGFIDKGIEGDANMFTIMFEYR